MVIGDWEIKIVDEQSIQNIPGDSKSPIQKIITYNFRYIPQDYILIRTVQYIKPRTDDDTNLYLENFTHDLKKNFIDPLFN